MAALSRELRKTLESTVIKARRAAEHAAGKALEALAVGVKAPYASMTDPEIDLRNRLRARGRQLGDWRNVEKGTQELGHLVSETAYEHWHRMLFARFLAENQLLIEPESGVAISIEEVKELAREQGMDWVALAGSYAVTMLPQVFRQDDPVLEVQFAPEDRKELEERLAKLPTATFTASDSLGWCYQFWQTERKKEVNDIGDKIGAEELPAVTQLFTEDYMVDFLLDNTLGAWHAGKVLAANPTLAESAQTEDELRQATSLPGCPWSYLRFIKGEDGKWTPAAGTFDGWPKAASKLTCLDPCMGSGHFVVAMFERLVALRMAEEPLYEPGAVEAVIRDNLFGLEIDPRCTQIGAFNLALAAWRRVGHCALPPMNLACSGLAPNMREVDWVALAGTDEKLKNGMTKLYRLFKDAPVLGSLINPSGGEGDLLVAAFQELQPLLDKVLAREEFDEGAHEMAVIARGLAGAAEILASRFTLVATNVPYLGDGKQDELLANYCESAHPDAKADLATCFVERCVDFCSEAGGSTALVTPQNWLFLVDYKHFRKRLLRDEAWNSVVRLGPRAFETIGGEVVNVALITLTRGRPRQNQSLTGFDVSSEAAPSGKARGLLAKAVVQVSQVGQLSNADWAVLLELVDSSRVLGRLAGCFQGISSTDSERFILPFWELTRLSRRWLPSQNPPDRTGYFRGREFLIDWETLSSGVAGAALRGSAAFGKFGIAIGQVKALPATLYTGEKFADSSPVIIPNDPEDLPAIWCYVSSPEFNTELRKTNAKLSVNNGYVGKVPFDLAHWQKVAAEKYPDGLPTPFSSDPTQWLFNGHPAGADQSLQVAVARLLGYQWPRQSGSSFPDCPALHPDGLEALGDDDGIVCLESLKGEDPAAVRLQKFLAAAFGEGWSATQQAELVAEAGSPGRSLDEWLRTDFFEQHDALFHRRPFIWHLWDGLQDGFHALVNYHKLAAPNGGGRRVLESLAFGYLGDWITRQRADQRAGKEGSDARLAAAVHLQNELKLILDGQPPYDIFVRWKPLGQQAIGWNPDINDGVRMNIRPFMMAKTAKGKSIFRKPPKVKWEKDRGKEPERAKREYPWFWSWDEATQDFLGGREFDGNRWNDLHYSNEVKQEARDRQKGKGR